VRGDGFGRGKAADAGADDDGALCNQTGCDLNDWICAPP
jgi:hypothetical protein